MSLQTQFIILIIMKELKTKKKKKIVSLTFENVIFHDKNIT